MGLNTGGMTSSIKFTPDMLEGNVQHAVQAIIDSNNATFDIHMTFNHVSVCMKATLAILAILQARIDIIKALIDKNYQFIIPRRFVDCGDYLPKNIEEIALLSNNQEIIQYFLKNSNSLNHLLSFQYCKNNKPYYLPNNQLPKAIYLLDENNSIDLLKKHSEIIDYLDFKEILINANSIFLQAYLQNHSCTFLPIAEYLFKDPFPLKKDYELYCDLTNYQIHDMLWLNTRRAKCLNILNNNSSLSDERKYYIHQIAFNESMKLNDHFPLTPQTNKLYQQCYHADYDYLDISAFVSGVLNHQWYEEELWFDELLEFTRFMNVRDRIPYLEDGILDTEQNLIRNNFDTYSQSLLINNIFPDTQDYYDI